MKTPEPAKGEAMTAEPPQPIFPAPQFDADGFSVRDLSRLYRTIDILEEIANGQAEAIDALTQGTSKAASFLTDLQEYLSEQRGNIVDALREAKSAARDDEDIRLATVVQYEGWCREFNKETLDQLAASKLAAEAI